MVRIGRSLLLVTLLCGHTALSQEQPEPQPENPGVPAELPGDTGLRDLMTARAFAMGGAYRALGIGGEAVTGNPAAMSLYRRYMVDVSGAWDLQTKFAFGNVSILDSSTNIIAAGLAYHLGSIGRGASRRIAHFNTVSSSIPLSENFMMGASVRHLLMTGAREANAITVDAGLLMRLFAGLTISLSGHNLIDVSNPDLTRYYALALGYSAGSFNVAADLRADFGIAPTVQLAVNAGAEYVVAGSFPIRVGYTLDRISGRQDLSGGLGIYIEGIGVDAAYRHELGGTNGHLVALTLRLQTTGQ